MFLVDTNVLSELRTSRTRKAHPAVLAWTAQVDPHLLFVSAITIHELEIGTLSVERRDALQGHAMRRWLEECVVAAFAGRILAVDEAVARRAAALSVPDRRPYLDGLIGGTALVHGMTVVTRNVRDFERTGVKLLNPWEFSPPSAPSAGRAPPARLSGSVRPGRSRRAPR